MSRRTHVLSLAALLLTGAIFGFFYAWICSTMWGLDALDPRIAIAAMQAMNESVRNAVFFPAFFLTPVILGLTAFSALTEDARRAALCFGAAALVYLLGGLFLTMAINVPMNETLGAIDIPEDRASAQALWDAYSPRWQLFNTVRTLFSGGALLLCGLGLLTLPRVMESRADARDPLLNGA